MGETKLCRTCERELPLEEFYNQKLGRFGRTCNCKACLSLKNREKYSRTKTHHRVEDALYVLELELFPGVFKIGHSSSPEMRRKGLESGHISKAFIRLVVPGMGWAESAVQTALHECRHIRSPGHEWFETDLETIREAIRRVVV